MRPDRIILGAIRGAECFDLLFAEFSDRDAGFKQHVYGDGGASWWDAGWPLDFAGTLARFPAGQTLLKLVRPPQIDYLAQTVVMRSVLSAGFLKLCVEQLGHGGVGRCGVLLNHRLALLTQFRHFLGRELGHLHALGLQFGQGFVTR